MTESFSDTKPQTMPVPVPAVPAVSSMFPGWLLSRISVASGCSYCRRRTNRIAGHVRAGIEVVEEGGVWPAVQIATLVVTAVVEVITHVGPKSKSVKVTLCPPQW